MMEQTIMPFKLESTEECLTAHGGLALFGEFCDAMKVSDQVNRYLPAPGSARGFMPSVYVQSLILMLHGGGRSLEDMRMLSRDDGLKPLLCMKVPSADAIGNWLRRMGSCNGLDALKVVQNKQLKWALKRTSEWKKHQVQTIRWRLYQIAARVTRHARALWMKIASAHIELFQDIRRRCYQLTNA